MNNKEKYELLAEGEIFQTSNMGVVPSIPGFNFSSETISSALNSNKEFIVNSFDCLTETSDSYIAEYSADITYCNNNFLVSIYIAKVKDIHLEEFGLGNMIDKSDYKLAIKQPYFAQVSVNFNNNPLESFHFQLKVLNTIVPMASLVIDFMSFRLLSGKWLKMTAGTKIPPSPDYLYALHAVYDENKKSPKYWFHTHGLLRCGCVELEILNTTSGPQQMYNLINNVVKRFLTDPIKENVKFTTGYDGLEINLTWIKWEEALNDFPPNILGSLNDRLPEDNIHREPSGILFGVEDKNLVSPEIYVKTLADNPILYISNDETVRMSKLAKERYPYFLDLFNKHYSTQKKNIFKKIFGKKDESPKWSFLVKLGLIVDNAKKDTEREHLWFELNSACKENVTGKLLNQPYWIASLNEGDVNTYPIEYLTDWLIYDPDGNQYTTDSVYQLVEI